MASDDDGGLQSNRLDKLVATLKGSLSLLPFGSLVGEILGASIPKQRLDRFLDTIRRLDEKLQALRADVDAVRARLESPEFAPVVEETVAQASRAFSEERRERLAALLASGVSQESFDRSRHLTLLRLFDEITDEEIVMLTFAAMLPGRAERRAFAERHGQIVIRAATAIGGPAPPRAQAGLHEYRKKRLVRLGLLESERGEPNDVTHLGKLLLKSLEIDVGYEIRL